MLQFHQVLIVISQNIDLHGTSTHTMPSISDAHACIIGNNNYGTRAGYGTLRGTLPLGNNSSLLLRCIYYAEGFTL